MIRILSTILIFISFIHAYGNSGPISIVVKDQQKSFLPGATVKLTQLPDSTVEFSITDQNGMARFEKRPEALYLLNISYIGYQSLEKTILVKNGQRNFEFQIYEQATALGEVTVTARRPLIRQDGDKMIIDPEPLIGISSNTMEMLETVPGVFVDQDGAVFLSSTTPAAIYINGREQRMGTQNIATVLRSLPPGSIQHIEVIRTPSTRFDAASSGGIINIVLKKGVRLGRFGAVNVGMNQGVYGNRFAGFNLNTSNDNTTWYINTSLNHNALEETLHSNRILTSQNNLTQSASTLTQTNQAFVGFGASYDARPNLIFSYDSRINGSLPVSSATTNNLMFSPQGTLFRENINTIENHSRLLNLQQDLGMVLKLDTMGSEWENRFSYSTNSGTIAQDYFTRFISPDINTINGLGDNNQIRHLFNLQSDLTWNPLSELTLETGIKASNMYYDSKSDYYTFQNEIQIEDTLRTNAFHYNENISSAYLQASWKFAHGIILKTGVRMEHTSMNGVQTIPEQSSFTVNRADWFPYAYLSRRLFGISGHDLTGFLIYRRSVTRPDYQNLNPYMRYLDQYLYETGNPSLKPQFTENYEANISYNDFPIFAFGRNNIKDIFSGVMYTDPIDSTIAVRTYDNIGKNRETYFRIVGAIPPVNKYFFAVGAQFNRNHYTGEYENQPMTFKKDMWRFFTFHSLSFTKRTRLTMSGFLMHNGHQQFYELKTFGQLNLGLSHSMLDRKLQITLNARDVLRTMTTHFELNQGTQPMNGYRYMDNQRIGINIRYNFGIRKRDEQRPMLQLNFEE
jgi:iron complex outermembrane recepter protein